MDPNALSGSDSAAAFLVPPAGAPVYHGFQILNESEIEGFRFGVITDFVAQKDTYGDAFVVAPDDSRAGLVWESEVNEPYFTEVLPPNADRWGVWGVGCRKPLRSERDARAFLEEVLPELRARWMEWKSDRR